MTDKETLTLMWKDYEVLSFEVNYEKYGLQFLEEKEHFDKAPYDLAKAKDKRLGLLRFFGSRAIPSMRSGFQAIMDATHCRNELELSFKGHGLSLSSHYWIKREGENLRYEDINFFTHQWDDSFGRALLRGDYEALGGCDFNVPDITTPGWGNKGWLYEDGPKLYKRGLDPEHSEEAICEVLASSIASRIIPGGEVLPYELRKFDGKYVSVSSCFLGMDEELVPLSSILSAELSELYREKARNKDLNKEFFDKLAQTGYAEWSTFFVKVACLRSLCFVSDLHFGNLSAIQNMETGALRLAPIYDFGGAFGSSAKGRQFLANANKAAFLLIYFVYGDLNPDWDYSWYDPNRLIGAEEEIRDYLSKTGFYTPEYIDCALDIFRRQKKMLDEMKK
ncbi:MAG: hypothetical protein J6A47_07000 [Bacilli bacterium]|nr:hypothetical protein [Bacilli bacterium]MBO6285003.1 hypothetical protein [Bacilli bacterium]